MKKSTVYFLFIAILLLNSYCSEKKTAPLTPANFILVEGGMMKNKNSQLYGIKGKVLDFYMGKFEVTQKEWNDIMPANPSNNQGDSLPVEMVTWYDCITYCNKRSNKEGLLPYYDIDATKDTLDGDIHINKCCVDLERYRRYYSFWKLELPKHGTQPLLHKTCGFKKT